MTEELIIQKFILALINFHKVDDLLLEKNVNERTLTSRLAYHMQLVFEDIYVDSEYNRNGYNPKQIHIGKKLLKKIYPDIIVHTRNDGVRHTKYSRPNILLVEAKKMSNSQVENDHQKLVKLTSHESHIINGLDYYYKYQVGIFWRPGRSIKNSEIVVYTKGKINHKLTDRYFSITKKESYLRRLDKSK